MAAENENPENAQDEKKGYEEYIEIIQKLKSESVPKERFEELKKENKKLLDTLTTGGTLEKEKKQTPEERDQVISGLRKDLFGSGEFQGTNLDYVSKSLLLRDLLIERGDRDPFLPYGKNVFPTEVDIEAAERTAKVMKECVAYADGDNNVFINELMRRTVETPMPRKK